LVAVEEAVVVVVVVVLVLVTIDSTTLDSNKTLGVVISNVEQTEDPQMALTLLLLLLLVVIVDLLALKKTTLGVPMTGDSIQDLLLLLLNQKEHSTLPLLRNLQTLVVMTGGN
jgi:hypothetical protein